MDKQEYTWEHLAKYFAGELTREEDEIMRTWIKSDPLREDKIKLLHKIWKESGKPSYTLNTDQSWERLSYSMDEMDRINTKFIRKKSTERSLLKIYSSQRIQKAGVMARRMAIVAASILILATAGILALQYQTASENEITEIENRVIMTRDGERASYVLSDGSRVILHAGSRLEIPENYNSENRELYLEGEAFFETVHNPDKPFIVRSGDSYTRVVGTKFLVQAWPNVSGERVEVIVSEGEVLFGNKLSTDLDGKNMKVLLSQNQRGLLSKGDTTPTVAEITDLDWYLGWTDGRLVFENRLLSEVFPRLERWYNIDIRFTDETLLDQKITAEIDYTLPMSDVLEGMAMTFGLEMKRDGRTITFFDQK
ncbi:MAG: FecR domain-containing protein [Balneolaceae bacterium]|nr:FecR domain-containing protein [Balneolaceae bacterium]